VTSDELEGTTLSVYAFIVRVGEPVGVRDVTRGAELSSTSVAHHHLQKLETLGLIEKNTYGRYTLKEKASVDGHVWVGKSLVPRLMFYSFFFMGAIAVEIGIILFGLIFNRAIVDGRLLFFTGMTFVTMLLFIIESLALYRKLNPKRVK